MIRRMQTPVRRTDLGDRTFDGDGRLRPGTFVETVEHEPVSQAWAPDVLASRRWGARGTVICVVEDGDESFYEVLHADGSVSFYEPIEVKVVNE